MICVNAVIWICHYCAAGCFQWHWVYLRQCCGTAQCFRLVVLLKATSFCQLASLLYALLRRSGVSISSPGLCTGIIMISWSEHMAHVSRRTSVIAMQADLPDSSAITVAVLSQLIWTVRPDRRVCHTRNATRTLRHSRAEMWRSLDVMSWGKL